MVTGNGYPPPARDAEIYRLVDELSTLASKDPAKVQRSQTKLKMFQYLQMQTRGVYTTNLKISICSDYAIDNNIYLKIINHISSRGAR